MTAATSVPSVIRSGQIIRRAGIGDVEAIRELAESALTSANWPATAYRDYCCGAEREGDTQAKVLFVAVQNTQHTGGRVIGFAAFSAITEAGIGECELENMAVKAEWRKRGVGGRLLAAGLLWCRTWAPAATLADSSGEYPADGHGSPGVTTGCGLWLEVRASNREAAAFYERAGFVVVGRRPAYYMQPTEDAILMRKVFDISTAC